jgi:uncharacterized membrane protein YdjX (TVP38/TMEM64 family)
MDARLKTIARFSRMLFLIVWAGVIVAAFVWLISSPESFSAANIAGFVQSFGLEIWFIYLGMSVLRGFTLLPSTPLVLAGTLLYPGQPYLVLAISMAGIAISSSLIYFFSESLGFAEYFERKRPAAVHTIRHRLEQPSGLAFVTLWSFFPFAPTDAVCYVAGTIRMRFSRFIAAVFLGELVICTIYVYGGGLLINSFR